MPRPKHNNPTIAARRSHAPYNFVRLPNKPFIPPQDLPRHDKLDPTRHTGYLTIEITTKSDLYVRCAPKLEKVKKETSDDTSVLNRTERYRQDFFHHGIENEPVIPGSSIKGMIRNMVEIMSSSRIKNLSDEKLIYRAVADQTSLGRAYRDLFFGHYEDDETYFDYPGGHVRAGYLEKTASGNWYIRPAKTYEVSDGEVSSFVLVPVEQLHNERITASDRTVTKVFVKPPNAFYEYDLGDMLTLRLTETTDVSNLEQDGFVAGYLVKPGASVGNNRHWFPVFYEPDDANDVNLISVSEQQKKQFKEDARLPRGNRKNRDVITPLENGEPAPVFYMVDDSEKLVFFGPCMMFRLPHKYSALDTVKAHAPELLTENSADYDLAEMMFGTVRKVSNDKELKLKGRISVSDAHWIPTNGDPFVGLKSPLVLSSPKPTAFQHYLNQPDSDDRTQLMHWSSDQPPLIRGYKRYWHRLGEVAKYENELQMNSTQHTVIRPVKPETTFQAKVRFENLSDLELGALLAAIRLDQNMLHKLGMGKPYGLGSVLVKISNLTLIDPKKRYSTLFANEIFREGRMGKEGQERISCAIANYTKAILEHEGLRNAYSVWDIPRLKEDLAPMLQSNLGPEYTSYLQLNQNNDHQPSWRRRSVLPAPTDVKNGGNQ